MKRTATTILLSALVVPATAPAQTKTGTSLAQFLGIEPSARVASMGNAGVALVSGIEAVYFNSGAIATLDRPAVQFTHSDWFAEINFNYAAATLPVKGFGTLFASVTSLNSGAIAVRTVAQPLGTGENYDVRDIAVGLGYGRMLSGRVATGLQIHYVSERIWHTSYDMITFSLGTVYALTENGLQLGAALTNLGTKSRYTGPDLAIQYDANPDIYGDNSGLPATQFTDEFPVPLLFRVGMSYPFRFGERNHLLLAVDALHPSDNTESANLGAEWTWNDTLALRGGYQTLFQTDSELGPTLGLGLQSGLGENRFEVDYAWADHQRLAETHRLTLTLEL
ncbi:MAG: PorV/PorQ family protein [bacterium]